MRAWINGPMTGSCGRLALKRWEHAFSPRPFGTNASTSLSFFLRYSVFREINDRQPMLLAVVFRTHIHRYSPRARGFRSGRSTSDTGVAKLLRTQRAFFQRLAIEQLYLRMGWKRLSPRSLRLKARWSWSKQTEMSLQVWEWTSGAE